MIIDKIVKLIENNDKIALFHHKLPDGDAISSSYALGLAIKKKYPNKTVKWFWSKVDVERRFPFLKFREDIICEDESILDDSWLSIIGDVSEQARTYNGHLITKNRIVFDHHNTTINHEVEPLVYYLSAGLPASAIQSAEIALAVNPNIDSETALMLYFGIVTDTGNFTYCDNDPRAFIMAAKLVPFLEKGVLRKTFSAMGKKSIEDIKYDSWVLSNVVIDGNLAYCIVPKSIQEELGLDSSACARPNLMAPLKGINAWALFIEYDDNWRCEYRSDANGKAVDVFARSVGGGGHTNASGSRGNDLAHVKDNIKKLSDYVNR